MATPGFTEIFERLRKRLLVYAGQMEVRSPPSACHLYIVNDVELAGRKYKESYFSGVAIKKTMVSFYFFPIYSHPGQLIVPAAIQKNLKGKSCFNFSSLSAEQEKAVAELLEAGAVFYRAQHILPA